MKKKDGIGMYKGKTVTVVVPAYNVAPHILQVLKAVPPFVDRIVVVDDCGTDETPKVLTQVDDPRVVVLKHETNQGVGGAMISGFSQALTEGIDFIVKVDGDGQMDPDYIPTLLDPLVEEGFGYVKGNRFLHNDRLRAMPAYRLIGNYGLTFLTKLASGYWHIFDPQNGFIAIRAEVVKRLDLNHLAKRYFFENDMLVHLNILNVRVKDVPIPALYDQEKSSMRLWEVLLTFPWYLFRRFWYRIYQKHILRDFSPIALFWVFGTSMFTWGLFFGMYSWAKSIIFHEIATTGTVMLSVLPFLLGFELILQGMILEIKDSPK
jgi:glycosyltransferase involved in cell wall biosynthesis